MSRLSDPSDAANATLSERRISSKDDFIADNEYYPDDDSWPLSEADAFAEEEHASAARSTTTRKLTAPRKKSGDGSDAATGGTIRSKASKSRPRSSQSRSSNARSSNARSSRPAPRPHSAMVYEAAGVLIIGLGILLGYNALRPSADGWLSRLGVHSLRWLFGVGAVVLPFALCAAGLLLIICRERANLRHHARGAGLAFLVLLAALHLTVPRGQEFTATALATHGGVTGGALAWLLRATVGEVGAIITLVVFSLLAVLFFTGISLSESAETFGRAAGRAAVWITGRDRRRRLEYFEDEDDWDTDGALPAEILEAAPPRRVSRRGETSRDKTGRRSPFLAVDGVDDEVPPARFRGKAKSAEPAPATLPETASEASSDESADQSAAKSANESVEDAPRVEITNAPPPKSVLDDASAGESPADETLAGDAVSLNAPDDVVTPQEALEAQALASAEGGAAEARKPRPGKPRRSFGQGVLMPEYFDEVVRGFDPPLEHDLGGIEEDIQQGVKSVQDTLGAFKIDARVTDVKRGPVITRYEVKPAPGVRVAAIANLDRDLARSLSAIAVRIEAPVPGKNVVGIEVPNKRVHLVRLRDVLELPEFLGAPSKLSFVLGKDIAGQPKWADLTKMPHLLIAGATNSGKSVCLNSIISSILARATPDEVRLSLIDPKRVELTLYRDVPHLYHPVVVEPKDAVRALRGAIAEMDRRYRKFAERGVRNIASYNQKLRDDEPPLPFLVIVIDELADLMMTAAAEFEKLICRLAQLARATGIHLIVATQRPSVNVLTGVIKANIPARIAFAVASQVDSRTILDSVGAERLIGSGDMLFDSSSGGKATRIQGAYLSEEEVNRVVESIKAHYADSDYEAEEGLDLESMESDDDFSGGSLGPSDDKRDDLYDEIREFVIRHDEMSASLIQRKFEIGYPRAGRIVDQLERDGVVGPADGPRPRKVLGGG